MRHLKRNSRGRSRTCDTSHNGSVLGLLCGPSGSRPESGPTQFRPLERKSRAPVEAALARQLVRAFIKHRRLVLQGHEDDLPVTEDSNCSLFDFKSFGLINRSIPNSLYDIFLSYKIESPPLGSERDLEFSLNATTEAPVHLSECAFELEESKYRYLLEKKGESLKRAGLSGLRMDEVSDRIRDKVNSNYIYNLSRSRDGGVLKFNIILELDPGIRSLCSLHYAPDAPKLRVITFY